MSTIIYKIDTTVIESLRYIIRGIFLIYFVYLISQILLFLQTAHWNIINFFESSLFYILILFTITFIAIDIVAVYIQNILVGMQNSAKDKLLGLIINYNNKLTLKEISQKIGLRENDVEGILAKISVQGEYSIQIDKDTGLVSIVPIAALVGAGTKEEKLRKLEALFKEGKISERTYQALKEKYSKEE